MSSMCNITVWYKHQRFRCTVIVYVIINPARTHIGEVQQLRRSPHHADNHVSNSAANRREISLGLPAATSPDLLTSSATSRSDRTRDHATLRVAVARCSPPAKLIERWIQLRYSTSTRRPFDGLSNVNVKVTVT